MPDTATPPAPPATPPSNPPGLGQTAIMLPKIEDDPNHAMAKLIANRGKKPDEKEEKPPEKAPETGKTDDKPGDKKPAETPTKVTDLLGKALNFRSKPEKKADDKPADKAPDKPAEKSAAEEKPAESPPADKPTPKRKAPAAPVVDAVKLATEVAREVLKETHKPEPEKKSVKESLKPDDRYDYEVAEHLAKLDARFKDAPTIILNEIQKTEAYAQRWQAANPDKEFNPKDEEHDEFYATLSRPWEDHEFRRAEIDLAAEEKVAKLRVEEQGKLDEVTRNIARNELAPVVDKKHLEATGTLVDLMGDKIKAAVKKGGYDALYAEDPVAANVVSATAEQLHPFIEAAVQIDDRRIPLNPDNPLHQQWNVVVSEGEARCEGLVKDGKTFARRADFSKMTPAQRARHWYLTTDDIIGGVVEYAAAEAKKMIDTHNTQLKQMGYVRQDGQKPATDGTPDKKPAKPEEKPSTTEKPESPTVGSGAKIDDTDKVPKSGTSKLNDQLAGILFRK